jgi:hypothetical protein
MKKRSKSPQKLAPNYQQILREQVIDEHGPGTILRDFEILLAFAAGEAPKVSKTNNLLPLKALVPLNDRLTNPLKVDLKRPQQKSYPHINGLYLLLRSSGIGYIEGTGTKLHLAVDDAVLQSWQSLNPTEKYCTLLETWIMRSSPEAIGEYRGRWDSPIFSWKSFFGRFSGTAMKIAGDKNNEQRLSYAPGLYILALLELFGFVTIKHGKPDSGKGWKILSIHKTPFGEAMLHLLLTPKADVEVDDILEMLLKYEEIPLEEIEFGELQPELQEYFPEWQNNLRLPEPEIQEGTYIFKVSLGSVWRRIAIPGTMELDWLSSTILDAFDFDHDHLYSFIYKNRVGKEVHINHPYVQDAPFTDEVEVQEVPLRPGASMTFLFDFGDNWRFNVQLERIEPIDPKLKKPKVLGKHGEAPEQYPGWDEEW